MPFKFAQEMDKKFNWVRHNPADHNSRRVSVNAGTPARMPVKAINEIIDRSTNGVSDLGRGIDELLEVTVLPQEVKDNLSQRYQHIQELYTNIQYYTKEQILTEAMRLKGKEDLDIDLVIALINRANKIATGYELRPAQILSVLEFFREKEVNTFCQINTGEGKTTITSAIAVIKSLQGETVDIITSNEVLAQDAIRARSDFYALFNLSVAHNNADYKYTGGTRDCYTSDIVYGTIGNFEFDYLRQLVKLADTKGERKFGSLIIDEADSVVLDNATHVAKTSGPVAGMEALKYVYINIWQELIKAEHSLGFKDTELAKITVENRKAIKDRINQDKIKSQSVIPQFLENYVDRKLDIWINNAIQARYDYHQNQHYIIDKKDVEQQKTTAEENIIPLDVAVGVTQQNTVWTGLHPFVQIKHNLQVTPDSLSSVFIANSEYIRLYKNISGLTGTLGSKEEREVIKLLYKANSTIIPTYKAARMKYEDNLLVRDDRWLEAVADDAIEHSLNQGRATLIVCNTMQDVLDLAKQLTGGNKNNNIKVVTYRDEHDAYKIEAINEGGGIEPGTIVVATNIGGRGTDIKLSDEVIEKGGLHECTTFIASSRILKQALGRAGRQGEPGSARIIIKQQDTKDLGINLSNNFSNQDIYDFVDKINNERIARFVPQIKKVESEGKYFARFADLYANGKTLKINHYILEDLKLQWALVFDERNDTKINELFSKFQTATENIQDYEHQFLNPYFAVNYAEFILAVEPSSLKEEDIDARYDKAKRVLNQNCVTNDPELLYAANMKLFEITISLAQRNELKRLAGSGVSEVVFAEAGEYKEQAKSYLQEARKALTKRLKYLEEIISTEHFHNIILPEEALNNNGENCLLKHLTSKHASLQVQLQHVLTLSELVNDSANDLVYISTLHSLHELLGKTEKHDLSRKICREELTQMMNSGEDGFYNLKTLPGISENAPKVQAAMRHIAAKFADGVLNLPSFTKLTSSTHDSVIGSGIFDIMRVIFSGEENPQAETMPHVFDAMAFDCVKVIECLKILHRVGRHVSQDIREVAANNNFFAELMPKVTEQLTVFDEKLANIKPRAVIKSPKPLAPQVFDPNQVLRGDDATKERDINGIDAYFGKYTLEAIRNILKLRIKDAGVDKVKITDNNYLFIDGDSNNIQKLVDELNSFTDSAIILAPLSLSNKHAVGIMCYLNCDQEENSLKIYYLDPENGKIPTELEQIFKHNQLNIEQLTTETQKYANCGPEVIEGFMCYLTGERLSQAAAVPYHSFLVEQDLLQNGNNTGSEKMEIAELFCDNNSVIIEPELSLVGLVANLVSEGIE